MKKKVILVEIPYCEKNETSSKSFLNKVDEIIDDSCEIKVKQITKKTKNLFRMKIKNPHPLCVIYKGVCTCKEKYVDKTKRYVETIWEGNSDVNKITPVS